MLQHDIARRLLDLDIFRDLDLEQAQRLARAGEKMLFKPGQSIIRAGEPGAGAYLIVAGEAVAHGPDQPPEPIAPGSLVGELAMLVDHDYRVTVTCQGQVRAMRLGRRMLREQMLQSPALAERLVARLNSRLMRLAVELKRVDAMLALAAEPSPAHQQAAP